MRTEAKGLQQGLQQGQLKSLYDLLQQGVITETVAANTMKVTVPELHELFKNII